MERVERLMTIPAVGPITALTWALEVGDVQRFSSNKSSPRVVQRNSGGPLGEQVAYSSWPTRLIESCQATVSTQLSLMSNEFVPRKQKCPFPPKSSGACVIRESFAE